MACQKVASANTQFAFEIYKHVAAAAGAENIFFSPVSISTALAMLSLGARSETLGQLMKGLGFRPGEVPSKELHASFQHLIQALNSPHSLLQLRMGNALFIQQELEPLQTFLADVKKHYHSETFPTDFQNEEEAKQQINSYVEAQTKGKIVDLLKRLDTGTVLVLINFIYFRGQWDKPFELESTREDDFHVDEHTTVRVPMMFNWSRYNIAHDQERCATVVQLPYKGNASAFFILPDPGKMKQLEDALSSSVIEEWMKSMHFSTIDLHMPRFSISGTLDLKDLLQKMGVTDVFCDQADLSGITSACKLKVSKALHKAVLSVDEKGTEAAAATALQLVPLCLPPTIKFDRPFLVVIYETETKSYLFTGKIVNPTAK
ncbi:alpha-1-antiproteinase-like [Ambystoma mexicanum]|uniref:alpha-1-antiproteinase-like n=1 Tax=Ambystoma mexicanum TaxID=8296 RepID=UPI0037E83CF7